MNMNVHVTLVDWKKQKMTIDLSVEQVRLSVSELTPEKWKHILRQFSNSTFFLCEVGIFYQTKYMKSVYIYICI